MDYERRYKEALERAKGLLEGMDEGDYFASNGDIENIFPELKEKESEDEKIRKAIHIYLDWLDGRKACAPKGIYSIKEMLAWLEKQSEKKPAENVEIKFCEGDKVVSNQDGKVYTVGTAYYVTGDGEDICLHDTDGNHLWTNRDDLDKNYHLWTSEDTKKLDADKVIEWVNSDEVIEWLEKTIRSHAENYGVYKETRLTLPYNSIEDLINDFKEDFGLC